MSVSLAPSKKYTMIEEFKDERQGFKNILNEIKETKIKIHGIKNETKRKLNVLNDEISNILEKLDVNITTLELRCRFCEKPHDFEKERELRLSAKERINKMKTLK